MKNTIKLEYNNCLIVLCKGIFCFNISKKDLSPFWVLLTLCSLFGNESNFQHPTQPEKSEKGNLIKNSYIVQVCGWCGVHLVTTGPSKRRKNVFYFQF